MIMSYLFYIELDGSNPLAWRKIAVPSTYFLNKLHLAIQGAFGWENSHLFEFCVRASPALMRYGILDDLDPDPEVLDARKTKMSKLFKEVGQRSEYIYDFGDYWKHRITLEKVDSEDLARPYCLEGVGACPPEDAVGIHGYDQMLEAVKSPKSDEAKEYREWLGLTKGEQWDPAFCSVRLVNKRLCLIERVYRSWLKIKRICRIYILLPVVMGRVKQPQALPSSLKF